MIGEPSMTESEALFGWNDDPWAREHIMSMMAKPLFADAAPNLTAPETLDVFFWELEQKLFGHVFETQLLNTSQGIGDCVSWGEGQSCQDMMLINIASQGGSAADVPGEVATEPIYGGSRCEVGDFGWNNFNDGSVGLYGAQWTHTKGGVLLRLNYQAEGIDLTTYDPQRAKQYGAKGCPDKLEPIAKLHPITAFAVVKSYEEVRDAICNWKAVANASNAGFDMKRRAQGLCERTTTWMHEMCYRGHCIIKGGEPRVIQKNSWGNYLGESNNRVLLESGREVILPKGHFCVRPEDVTFAAKQGDTTAKAGINGWAPQTFSWD